VQTNKGVNTVHGGKLALQKNENGRKFDSGAKGDITTEHKPEGKTGYEWFHRWLFIFKDNIANKLLGTKRTTP